MIIFGPPYKVELPPEQIHFITGLTVNTINPYTFTPDSGFPYTAFAGAFFQIEIDGAVPVSGAYGFNVNDPAVSVSDTGIVKFDSEPSGSEIIITITPADASGIFVYTLLPARWFSLFSSTRILYASALTLLESTPDYRMPEAYADVTVGRSDSGPKRNLGSLCGEWGNIQAYMTLVTPRIWIKKSETSVAERYVDVATGSYYSAAGDATYMLFGIKDLTA